MSLPGTRRYTEAEYLAMEVAAETKHEYRRGEILAMVGGAPPHNQITFAIGGLLYSQLAVTSCIGFNSDQRVRVREAGPYCYPDVTVVCGEPQYEREVGETLLNPTVIFEVLSPSTEAYDRGDKFQGYRTVDSLREYVLVSQTAARVEQFVRQEGGLWLLREVASLDAPLELASVACQLPLKAIYAGLDVA